MTGSSENLKHKTTPGEELYLIHLRRMREEEDDHDYLPRKRRSLSVGEELWEIHKRRSKGIEDDLDREIPLQETHPIDNKTAGSKEIATLQQKKPHLPQRRYNLRSADPTRKKSWIVPNMQSAKKLETAQFVATKPYLQCITLIHNIKKKSIIFDQLMK